jgi:hypothetical protein
MVLTIRFTPPGVSSKVPTIEFTPGGVSSKVPTIELTPGGVSSKLLAVELIHRTIKSMPRTLDVMVKTIVVQVPSVGRLGGSVEETVASVPGNLPAVSAMGPLAVQCPSNNFSRIEALT